MLFVSFISWWYGPGWKRWASHLQTRLTQLYQAFSVPILLRTMFMPWRRIMTPPGRSLDERLRAMVDNTVSRLVGFTVRLIVILTALGLMLLWLIIGLIEIIIWPLLPIISLGLIVWGLLP